jgi:hypothetical protein
LAAKYARGFLRGGIRSYSAVILGSCESETAFGSSPVRRGFIQAGYVDPDNLLFARERIREVREVAPKVYETINTLDGKCAEIFRGHPFYDAPDIGQMLRRLVERPDLKLNI